jgi:hypothetical protein
MSVSTEVQRTLVKSPPELWSELSDPQALSRHLAELGEIRITSVEPETKVEWEAEGANGVVYLKQSGWGTKVTLSLTREAPHPEEQPVPEPVAAVEPEPVAAVEPEPIAAVEPEPVAAVEPEPVVEPEPEPIPESGPELGFFARLFRRRKPRMVEPEIEVVALAAPEPIYPEPPPEPVADLAAELVSVEAQMTEETTELLTGVLDRLGAAHHRPFSRG